ncbi:MAG: ATP-binding response regulator, partial [Thermoanaerobaculia bacterium]
AVRPSAAAKNIAIETAFSPDIGSIMADPTRLQQIVWNLLANAVKFTHSGGVVEIRAGRSSSQIEIAVKDNGQGIDVDFLPHIFEPFRQAETPQTRVHGGLGLGLSIVRYLTEAQGGTVTAESAGKGKGATFTLSLPLALSATPVVERTSLSRYGEPGAGIRGKLKGVKILVVDDDPESRNLITATLGEAGASVTSVGSSNEALSALDKERFEVVLTDIAMPHTDGYELAQIIRKRGDQHGIKIIALSAFSTGEGTLRQRFDAYLNKPIDPFALVDSVASVVAHD